LIDEHLLDGIAAHVRAGQIGIFNRGCLVGPPTFGYRGVAVPGEQTNRGFARKKVEIDPEQAEIVELVFAWFVRDELPVAEKIPQNVTSF